MVRRGCERGMKVTSGASGGSRWLALLRNEFEKGAREIRDMVARWWVK